MRHALKVAALSAALIVGAITTTATAAPVGMVNPTPTIESGNDLVVKAGYGHRGWGHRRGGFAVYLGAPVYYGYTRSCWWSHRHHRRVCAY
jgi:hypothetical protein